MTVPIVILHFNKTNLTRRCIQSALDSGYPSDTLFAFDNGSGLDTYEQIRSGFPQINHRRIELNRGFSGGFNAALRWVFESGFSSAMFCTNDTYLLPQLTTQCAAAAQISQAGIIAPKIVHLRNPEKIDSLGAAFDPESCTLHHRHTEPENLTLAGPWDYVPGTALWITADAFQTLNGADESYFTYWEDADLSFRARQAGIPLAVAPRAEIRHGIGQTCHKKPLYTAFYYQRNRIRFCRTHLPAADWPRAREVIRNNLFCFQTRWENNQDKTRLNYLNLLFTELDSPSLNISS